MGAEAEKLKSRKFKARAWRALHKACPKNDEMLAKGLMRRLV